MVLGLGSLWFDAGAFLVAAAAIGVVGPRLGRAADRVGSITGIGRTLAGAVLLGASTSLPGLIVTFRTALAGRPTLAVGNALGGIAAQTLFIAAADVALRSGTIQHEDTLAASLMQSAVLITLLTLVLVGMLQPGVAILGSVHPVSVLIAVGVLAGFAAVQETRKHPSWRAVEDGTGGRDGSAGDSPAGATGDSPAGGGDGPDAGGEGRDATGEGDGRAGRGEANGRDGAGPRSAGATYGRYAGYVVVIGVAGYLISGAAGAIVDRTGFSPLVMGLTFTAVATSLPELVTAVSSVRRDAVGLAIGDIVGGNAFDTVMVAVADVAFVGGSIYTAVTPAVEFVAAVAVLMTGVLVVGFVRREREGPARIGVESYLIVATYAVMVAVVLLRTGVAG